MSRTCEICGKSAVTGNRIVRRGMAKRKGGIGLHTTGVTRRRFNPNLHRVRVAKAGGGNVRMVVCAACIKGGRIVKT